MSRLQPPPLVLALAVVLAGCAGVGVVATTDPYRKLADANHLFDQQDRPLLAEVLIREAITICEDSRDQPCLAEAYRTYGFFFRSASIDGKWNVHYRKNGFLEKSATFDTRYAKSIEYFEKARQIFAQIERIDILSNINLNMGFTYELMGRRDAACRAFEESVDNNREALRRKPDEPVNLPEGIATFEDYLTPHRKRVGCQ